MRRTGAALVHASAAPRPFTRLPAVSLADYTAIAVSPNGLTTIAYTEYDSYHDTDYLKVAYNRFDTYMPLNLR